MSCVIIKHTPLIIQNCLVEAVQKQVYKPHNFWGVGGWGGGGNNLFIFLVQK